MEDLQEFDGIVLGEVRPRVWMPGSHLHQRTETAQDQWPTEDAAPGAMVQLAVTWQGNRITLVRNGRALAEHLAGAGASLCLSGRSRDVLSDVIDVLLHTTFGTAPPATP